MADKLPLPLLSSEILTKLPVKSLLRFRCVSKPWKSTIDDPHFITLHLKNSLKNLTNHSLILQNHSSLYSLHFPALKIPINIKNPFQNQSSLLALLGSCNGLLCLIDQDFEWDPLVYNPLTREKKRVPVSKCGFLPRGMGMEMEELMSYGFGYDHVNDDYKLVRIVQFDRNSSKVYREIKVYSLRMNSWMKVKDLYDDYVLLKNRDCGVYLNGCLHWLCKNVVKDDGMFMVVAFDLGTLEWKFVSKSKSFCGHFGGLWVTFGVLGGCLSTACNFPMDRTEFWVMKEYGVKDSWTKICVLSGSMIGYSTHRVLPIAYSMDRSKVLVVQEEPLRLFWFDLERKTIENVKVPGVENTSFSGMLVESLVSLGSQDKIKPKTKSDKMDGFLSKGFKLKL